MEKKYRSSSVPINGIKGQNSRSKPPEKRGEREGEKERGRRVGLNKWKKGRSNSFYEWQQALEEGKMGSGDGGKAHVVGRSWVGRIAFFLSTLTRNLPSFLPFSL